MEHERETGARISFASRAGMQEINPSQLRTICPLGEGAFATVEKCEYTDKNGKVLVVAVKKLKPEIMDHPEDVECFLNEVNLQQKLVHPHIIHYVGLGHFDDAKPIETMFLVNEVMEGGSLKTLVNNQMQSSYKSIYTLRNALDWCIHIAEALEYLHASQPMVIHRDLKLDNILLKGNTDDEQTAVLTDFGLVAYVNKRSANSFFSEKKSIAGDDDDWESEGGVLDNAFQTTAASKKKKAPKRMETLEQVGLDEARQKGFFHLRGQTGSLMYMAPENFLCEEDSMDEKVDVFSFGVVMYELLHKYRLLASVCLNGTEDEIYAYAQKVSSGFRPPISEILHPDIRCLIEICWDQNPEVRPSMVAVVDRLLQIKKQGLIPVELVSTNQCCADGGCTIC